MKIVFTICSNNYLAQAKTLFDSIQRTNPDYLFFVGLTDVVAPGLQYDPEIGGRIVPVAGIGIPGFDDLWKRYSIIEFNTCVKPFYFQYFINLFPDLEYLVYLDPDIMVFNSFSHLENEFREDGRVLLTPHITTPIALDDQLPNEHLFLNYGIYNLGFLALKMPGSVHQMINWWKERTYHLGFNQTANGLFVDQLWFNLVPLFFDNILISKHPGLNMAPWNLHERRLSQINGHYFVNTAFPLVFYHFSKYRYNNPDVLSKNLKRYNFDNTGILRQVYQQYHQSLIANGIEKYGAVVNHYMNLRASGLSGD